MAKKQSLPRCGDRQTSRSSGTSGTDIKKGGGAEAPAPPGPPPQADTTWYDALLGALRAGASIRLACHSAGVGRTTLYRRLQDDPDFAGEFEDARLDSIDILVEEVRRRALEKSDLLLIFELKARCPEVYGTRPKSPYTLDYDYIDWTKVPDDVLERIKDDAVTPDDVRLLTKNAKENRMVAAFLG